VFSINSGAIASAVMVSSVVLLFTVYSLSTQWLQRYDVNLDANVSVNMLTLLLRELRGQPRPPEFFKGVPL
jgi:hypothetical protein